MTTYVKPDGDDSAAGTASATSLAALRFAIAVAVAEGAGAEVEAYSTAQSPLRVQRIEPIYGYSQVDEPIGASISLRVPKGTTGIGAYVTTSLDISEGVSRGNYLYNGDFEQIVATNNVIDWEDAVGTGTLEKETTEVPVAGDIALKSTSAGAYQGIRQNVYLPKNCTFRLVANVRQDTNLRNIYIKIWDRANNTFWDNLTPEWYASPWLPAKSLWTNNVRNQYVELDTADTNNIVTAATGRHAIEFADNTSNATVMYLASASLTNVTAPTYSWTADTTSGVYYVNYMHFVPVRVLICTNAEWNANGMEAFASSTQTNYPTQDDLATCRTTELSSFVDTANDRLYIHLPAGVIPSDVHIEAYTAGAALECGDDVTIAGLGVTGLTSVSLSTANTANLYGLKAIAPAVGFISTDGVMNCYKCDCYNTTWDDVTATNLTEGEMLALSGGELNAYGGFLVRGSDDGMQSDSGATIRGYGVVSIDRGAMSGSIGAHDFKIGNADGGVGVGNVGVFKYCTAVNGTGAGFISSATITEASTFTIENCLSSGHTSDFSLPTNANVTLTVNQNIGGTYFDSSGSWAGGTNNQSVADADVTSVGVNSDGSIASDSPAVNTGDATAIGNLWAAGTSRYSAAFDPFPSRILNKGADQR